MRAPLARHMGKYIPGNPNIVVQNMVGGGGMRAINHLYNIAAKDGSVIGMVHSGLATSPLAGRDAGEVRGDEIQLDRQHAQGRHRLPRLAHRAGEEIRRTLQTTELVVGSTGPGSGFHIMATLLRNMFGAKLKTIAGYESGPHLLNAVEKEETQGTCGIAMASIAISHPHWLRDKLINLLIQTGLERDTAAGACRSADGL